MIKVKDGYAKLIGTTYLGSADRVLLSNGGDHVLGNASGNIPLSNGTVNTNLNSDLLDGVHLAGYGGRLGVMRSWSRGTYTTVNLYFGNGNIVVIDPKPTDDSTLSPNTIIFSLGEYATRNTLLAFFYEIDRIKYRRAVDGPTWGAWRTIAFTDSDISGTAAYANILKSNSTTSVSAGLLFYAGWIPQGNTNNRSWCSPTGNYTNNSVKGEYGSIVRVNYGNTYYNELFFDANSTRPSWRKITGTNSTGWKTLGLQEDIRPSGYVTSSTAGLSSYWGKLWLCTRMFNYNDLDITFYIHSAYNLKRGFVHIRVRRNPVTTDGVTTYIHDVNLILISGNIPTSEIRLYHDATSGKMELWVNVVLQYGVYNATVISCTHRTGNELIPIEGTLFSNGFTTVLTLPTYSYITLSNLNSNQIHVLQHTANNTEYPLIWSNLTNTSNITTDLLYKSYNHLTYNPGLQRISVLKVHSTEQLLLSAATEVALRYGNTDATSVVLANEEFRPYSVANSKINLGNSSVRWKGLYALTGNFSGDVLVSGALKIGSNSTRNYIAFHGTTADGDGAFNHTYIGENLYYGTESSELVLFKGNDQASNAANPNGTGPDRIRHIAAGHLFQIYKSHVSGTFETVCTSTVPVNILSLNPANVTSYVEILPNTSNTCNLGSSSKYWNYIYGNRIRIPITDSGCGIAINWDDSSVDDNDVARPWYGLTWKNGNDTVGFNLMFLSNYFGMTIRTGGTSRHVVFKGGHVRPYSDNTQTLGTTSNKWLRVFATTFDGTATNVLCLESSSDVDRPILVTNSQNQAYYTNKVTLNYSTGNITAPTFTGSLKGNADTATNATNADTVDNYHMTIEGHYLVSKSITDTTNATWYVRIELDLSWNGRGHRIICLPSYNNVNGVFILEIPSHSQDEGYIAKVSSYNKCNIKAFCIVKESLKICVYLLLVGYTGAYCAVSSTCNIDSLTVVSAPSYNFINVNHKSITTNYEYRINKLTIKHDYPSPLGVCIGNRKTNPTLGNLSDSQTAVIGEREYGTTFWTRGSGDGYIQQGRFDGKETAYNLILQALGGNVGINTESPGYKLHVNGTGAFNLSLHLMEGAELHLKAAANSTDPGDIVFKDGNNTEIGRIFKSAGVNEFNVRFSASDSGKVVLHSGNSSVSDYAVKINNTTKNFVRDWGSGAADMNAVARGGRSSMGMANLIIPKGTATAVNPNGLTGWHHFINMSFDDGGGGSNAWITQIANKAGSTDLWVRSRYGGTIDNTVAWVAGWTRILTGSNYTSVLDGNYVKAYKTLTNTYNIDDDWGLSVITFDPKAKGTYPSSGNLANFTLLNLGNHFSRRKQFGFDWYTDSIFYRRHIDSWTSWVTLLHSGNYSNFLDSRYYTETEVNNKLAGYLPLAGGTMSSNTAQIQRAGSYVSWYLGRSNAMIRINSYSGYNAIASMKTTNGDWSLGVHSNNTLYFTYITDTNFNANTNTITALVSINASGNLYATHFYENSDEQLKTNIQEILNSDKMPIIKEFNWKEDNSHSYGLIAQELEEQGYSELVSVKDDGYKTVNYSAALSLIVGKLQVKIKELEKEIENLKNKN